ncbi:HVA22H, partial [Symbiodinium sp. KB8]
VPLYWEGKIAFVLWLTLPRFRGATYLYEQAVAPYITQYEGDIDKHLASLADSASAGVAKLKEAGAHHLRQHSTQALTLMAEMVSPRATTAPALSDIHEGADAAPPAHATAPARAGVDSEGVLQEGPNGFDTDAKPASTLRQRRK